MLIDTIKQQLKGYFDLTTYLEDENEAKQSIIEGVSFRGPNIIILVLAILVASLGLNTNSPAVIIGAMLISPLMGPIIGIGLGVGIYDFPLIKRSARNLAAAALFSVIASTLFFLISPVSEERSELLARTSPTIYDVLIGFIGGAAGIVAIACKQKGNVIPGVAIATALMPPLCTAGYGLATWQLQYFTGAFYLFLINSIFIALATLIGVKLFKFKQYAFVDPAHRKRIKRWVTTVVVITLLPSIFLTVQMLRESYFVNDANAFIDQELDMPNTQIFNKKVYIRHWKKYIDVTLIGEEVNVDSLQMALTSRMGEIPMLHGTTLKIKQGFSTGFYARQAAQGTSQLGLSDMFTSVMGQIDKQRSTIDSLRGALALRNNFDSLSFEIAPEIKVLYPEIKYFALARNLVCDVDTRRIDTLNIAIVQASRPLPNIPKIEQYIMARTGLTNLHIITTDIESQQPKPKQPSH